MRQVTIRAFLEELAEYNKVTDMPHLIRGNTVIERDYALYVIERHPKHFFTTVNHFYEDQSDNPYSRWGRERYYIGCHPTNIDHGELFFQSQVREHGVQHYYPGAAVGAQFDLNKNPDNTWNLNIAYIQFCFKTGSPKQLTRSLASKYIGFREKLIAFGLRRRPNVTSITVSNTAHKKPNLDAIDRILAKEKIRFERSGGEWHLG